MKEGREKEKGNGEVGEGILSCIGLGPPPMPFFSYLPSHDS